MKINAEQLNRLQRQAPSVKKMTGVNQTPLNNNLNFGANITKNFDPKTAKVVYENASELIEKIENSLGKGYFSDMLEKGEVAFDKVKNTLSYTDRTLKYDARRTLTELIETPIRIINAAADKVSGENKPEFLKTWSKNHSKQKAFNSALDILDEFINPAVKSGKKATKLEIDPEKCSEIFKNTISSNITKIKKNYESRDERTLNRIVTATVSALYSADDFYNISMLQKNDDKEAKKSHKKRFNQEIKRMATSALFTFISLGMLDRYTKKNIFLNALVIAGSTLLAEIISRVSEGNSLVPLTPKQAALKAQKEKGIKNVQAQNDNAKTNVAFKANLKDEKEIFKNFAREDGSFATIEALNKTETSQKPKKAKKTNIIAYIFAAFAAASTFYLAAKKIKGDFDYNKAKAAFCKKYENSLEYNKVTDEMIQDLKAISKEYKERSEKFEPLAKLKTLITKKKVKTDLAELEKKITKLKRTKEGRKISDVLDIYLEHIATFKDKKTNKFTNPVIESEVDILGISGLYSGLTKIIETVYTILSLPGAAIMSLLNRKNADACKTFDKLLEQNAPKYKKELTELNKIFHNTENGRRLFKNRIEDNNTYIAKEIGRRARNVEIGAETGDLANISRTMVTAITTYFFVNDYRNRVLIESEGKDVEGANEEAKERLMHKLSNFVINGTLMNTFNNVFKGPLNDKLINAAIVAGATETTNEFLVRKSICSPIGKKSSRQAIIDYEQEQMNKDGFMGWWTRTFRKLTGKKSLTQKAGIDIKNNNSQKA